VPRVGGPRGGKRGGAAVKQYPTTPVVSEVVISTPPPVALQATDTYQFTATVLVRDREFRDGAWEVVVREVVDRLPSWTTTNAAVATINSSGLLTAVGNGTCGVVAIREGVTGATVNVTVTGAVPTVATVTVNPATPTVFEAATAQLTAIPKDSGGNVIPGLSVSWGTSNAAVATVDTGGLVTGVAAGSATITATVSAIDGTAAVTVAVVPVAGTPVTLPSSKYAFILGPLIAPGDRVVNGSSATLATSPWPYFDKVWYERGTDHTTAFPSFYPQTLPGTVAITDAGTAVTGTGTNFLTAINPSWFVETLYGNANFWGEIMIRDAGATWRGPFYAASVASDTSFTLTVPWTYGDVSGVNITTNNPTRLSGQKQADLASDRKYYDLAFALYQYAYAASDATFLTGARKVATSWLSMPNVQNGYGTDLALAPRSTPFMGMIVRALELDDATQTHAVWDWLVRYADDKWPTWIGNRLADSTLYFGLRDGSYVIQLQAALAAALPDTYTLRTGGTATNGATKRATYRQRARDGCVSYLARLQGTAPDASARPPGLWSWNDNDVTPNGKSWSIQFQYGLAADALIHTHRLLVDTGWPTASDITAIESAIIKACEALYEADPGVEPTWTNAAFRHGPITDQVPHRWRAFWYYYYGGVTGNLTRDYPDNKNQLAAVGSDATNKIRSERQNNCLNIAMFGYAYKLTGDPKFLQYGDDIMAASYGRGQGVGSDPFWSLHDHIAKNYNQGYRNTAKYLAWRAGV